MSHSLTVLSALPVAKMSVSWPIYGKDEIIECMVHVCMREREQKECDESREKDREIDRDREMKDNRGCSK